MKPPKIGSKAWLRANGAKGGSVSSEAKARAARLNGLRGGRPKGITAR